MTLVHRVLDEFAEQGLQSDARFAESFVRQRYNNGYGERRIEAELRQKQVEDAYIRQAFSELEGDWFEAARVVYRRKYANPIQDQKDRFKRLRFMQYRGFTQEQTRYAMEDAENE
ncbi:regulatory protein RecX [Saliniradius amylolyticus]